MSCPYRLAAIDLDGTLLGPDKQISPENRDAVEALQEAGVLVVLASGRKHENMTVFHETLRLRGPVVSAQGALVKEAETGEVLHRCYMPADLAEEVFQHGLEEELTLLSYFDEGIYVSQMDSHVGLYQSRGGDEVIESADLGSWQGRSPQKIIWLGTAQCIASRYPAVERRYRGRSDTLISDPEYLEFMALGVNKAAGLAAVATRYGIHPSQVATFGDGNNDVSMLEWAGMGVAMTDSTPAAKAAANWISPAGAPETSFARAVAQILGAR